MILRPVWTEPICNATSWRDTTAVVTGKATTVYGGAELSADYCVSNTATRVRLRLQAACFNTYAGSWRLEERELTSQSPSSLRSY